MKASATVTIYATIDQVFDFIANIENNDQWINGVTEPAWTSVSVMETGATFQSMYTYGGKTHEIAYEITALETPRLMATRSTSGPFPFDSEVSLKSIDDKTRITNTLNAKATNWGLGLWFTLFGVMIRPFMARQLQRELMLVKTLLENPEDATRS
jgi:uncharacterized membrane protein